MSGIGYHAMKIEPGDYGHLSKIQEELDEVIDAQNQGIKVMVLLELSDLYGAVEGYLEKHHPETTMKDLKDMSDVTKRAFRSGARTSKD